MIPAGDVEVQAAFELHYSLLFWMTPTAGKSSAPDVSHAPLTRFDIVAHLFHQIGASMVSCVFANDTKEYLVVGTAYVREDVSEPMRQTLLLFLRVCRWCSYVSWLVDGVVYFFEVGIPSPRWEHLVFSTCIGLILGQIHLLLWAGV